jgi:hypothetical protein
MKVRAGLVTVIAVVALGVSACGPDHHQAENTTGAALTPDKGEIKGTLVEAAGPGSSAQPLQGNVDVYPLGGNQVSDDSGVSAWDFELKPGAYRVQATVNRVACNPVEVKIVKGTIQDLDIACPIS